jgi:hypothetical protein
VLAPIGMNIECLKILYAASRPFATYASPGIEAPVEKLGPGPGIKVQGPLGPDSSGSYSMFCTCSREVQVNL